MSWLRDWKQNEAVLLGSGGEAQIYALDSGEVGGEQYVVRLYRHDGTEARANASLRIELSQRIADWTPDLPFATPQIVERGEYHGRPFHIEKRLEGLPLSDFLQTAEGAAREVVIIRYLETAELIADIGVSGTSFGEIGRIDAIQTSTWEHYLSERAQRSLAVSNGFSVDATTLCSEVPPLHDEPALVHLDYCPANVMTDGHRITAVIDFGYATILGDRRLNAVAAAAHLLSPEITSAARDADRPCVLDWLSKSQLDDYFEPARRWLAAYWTFAHDDPDLMVWCRRVLGETPT